MVTAFIWFAVKLVVSFIIAAGVMVWVMESGAN